MRCAIPQCPNPQGFELKCKDCERIYSRCKTHRNVRPARCFCTDGPTWIETQITDEGTTSSEQGTSTGSKKKQQGMKRKREEPKKYSRENVSTLLQGVTQPSSMIQSGRWTPNMNVRGLQSFSNKRQARVLRWLASQIFWFIKKTDSLKSKKEDEVQAMLVNDRILISANRDQSIAALISYLKRKNKSELEQYKLELEEAEEQQKKRQRKLSRKGKEEDDDEPPSIPPPFNPLYDILLTPQNNDRRSERNSEHFTEVFEGTKYPGDESVNVLVAFALDTESGFVGVDISSEEDCREKIESSDYEGTMLFVNAGSPQKMHAEQKLVQALYRSGHKGRAYIYGKKRPCTGCSLTLRFAREWMGLDILYNDNPGGFWEPALFGLDSVVKNYKPSSGDDRVAIYLWMHEKIMTELQTMYQSKFQTQKTELIKLRGDRKKTFKSKDSVNRFESAYDSCSETDDSGSDEDSGSEDD